MSTISTSSVSFRPQTAPGSSTINSGPTAGNVLDGKGSDFLDPDNVLGTSTNFADSITPVTSRTSQRIFGTNPLGSNPNPLDVLNATRSGIRGALTFNLSFNPGNVNPLGWINPSPTDIILGSLNAQAGIFNGSPIFNPIPSFPSFPLPTSATLPAFPLPANGGANPPSLFTPGYTGFSNTSLQGGNRIPLLLIPIIQPVPVPIPIPVGISQPMTQQPMPQNPMALLMQTQVYGLFQSPVRPAQSVPVQSYSQQSDMMLNLLLQSGELLSRMLRQLIDDSRITGSAGNSGNSGSAGGSAQAYSYD